MNAADVFSTIGSVISNQDVIVRIILAVFLTLYGFYAIILSTQIRSLIQQFNQTGFSNTLRLTSLIHAIIVFGLLLFIILTL